MTDIPRSTTLIDFMKKAEADLSFTERRLIVSQALLMLEQNDHEDIDQASPYRSLPAGIEMRVAIRRSLRVGSSAGTPVEDLGVRADEQHQLTRADILHGNVDLIEAAGKILKARHVRRLALVSMVREGEVLVVRLTVHGFDQLDSYVDGRPWGSQTVHDGEISVRLEGIAGAQRLRFEGYEIKNGAREPVANLLTALAEE
jgi:hypothetical protein